MQHLSTLRPVNIATELATVPDETPESVTIYCPSCRGLKGISFESVALLPIHDANGRLLAELRHSIHSPRQIFAGILALDPFRRHVDILKTLESAGCSGIINFPSVTAIDGEMRISLEDLGYGITTEIDLLRTAVAHGFRALALVDSFAMAQEALVVGASGLVATRHANEGELSKLSELARETTLGLFRLPDGVGGA
ncbi:phosphoenolpyruvate hydrolase family protein [Bradyrhizobium sp. DASA03076]|uniref:phosphoenolpyruvate hydrolase family protein n=1 Tax=Bradyrhizobium sp. BLXBL-03 TaxID=3395916 RepID=UPI003F708258